MSELNLLVDTSVAVAMAVSGHEAHELVMDATEHQILGLAGHAWFESFSVLTRLPPPARRSPAEVATLLRHNFPESRFLSAETTLELATTLGGTGIAGAAVYDALVGYAAAAHGRSLLSRDRRAIETYRAVGANVELLS